MKIQQCAVMLDSRLRSVEKLFSPLAREESGPGCAKQGWDDPGLERNLKSIMKAWKENSSLILFISEGRSSQFCISQFQLRPAPPPPPTSGYCGAFARLFNPGVGYLQILRCPGAGICQPRGYSRAFDTHAVRHQNITTKRILLEKQQIRSSVKDSWL